MLSLPMGGKYWLHISFLGVFFVAVMLTTAFSNV